MKEMVNNIILGSEIREWVAKVKNTVIHENVQIFDFAETGRGLVATRFESIYKLIMYYDYFRGINPKRRILCIGKESVFSPEWIYQHAISVRVYFQINDKLSVILVHC